MCLKYKAMCGVIANYSTQPLMPDNQHKAHDAQ